MQCSLSKAHQGALHPQSSSFFLLLPSSDEVVDCHFDDPQVYESMCNIQSQAGSSEAPPPSEPGESELQRKNPEWQKPDCCLPTDPPCLVSDRTAPPPPVAAVGQDKKGDIGGEKEEEEDIYEYDFPRPVAPPAPTRRAMSDMGGTSTAFSCLSIDGAVEASTSLPMLSLACRVFPCSSVFVMACPLCSRYVCGQRGPRTPP